MFNPKPPTHGVPLYDMPNSPTNFLSTNRECLNHHIIEEAYRAFELNELRTHYK